MSLPFPRRRDARRGRDELGRSGPPENSRNGVVPARHERLPAMVGLGGPLSAATEGHAANGPPPVFLLYLQEAAEGARSAGLSAGLGVRFRLAPRRTGGVMPARTGRQYLAGLREQEREVWLEGERVKDPTRHPGLQGGARAIASLYDMQCDPEFCDEMTYVSPSTGDRVGRSFIIPRTREDLEKRRAMMLNWARTTCGTPGLKFLCRESFDLGRSHFDHPLGSRFEEMDCVVFFDDVLVPWERVFLLGDVDLLNRTANVTHSSAHSAHQGAVKNLAKAEFVLGVALLMTQTLGNSQLPNVEERIGELMLYTQLTRACMRAAEADAELDEWGVMCPDLLMVESPRNLFSTAYPRRVEILQLLGSSSFMLTPTEADMKGPLGPAIERYLAPDNSPAEDRVKLFRLAWDIAGTSFGSRQVLYERFFASDPLTRARALAW